MIVPKTELVHDQTGIFVGVKDADYRAAPGYSNSELKLLRQSPRDFNLMKEGKLAKTTTDAMEYGKLFHSAVLDNRKVSEMVHIQPTHYGPELKPWHNGAAICKDWNAHHTDKPVLTDAEFNQLSEEVKYVKNHKRFGTILGSYTEVSLFARAPDTGYLLKGRLDILVCRGENQYIIGDLKTMVDASTAAMSREILSRGYHIQAAHYRYLLKKLIPDAEVKYLIGGIQKGKHMKCNFRYLSNGAMDVGEQAMMANLDLLKKCRLSNNWPEWHDEEDGIGYVDLPDYCYNDLELTGATEGVEEK